MIPLDDNVRTAIRDGRIQILENCADLIEEATTGFSQERFPRSCFLAMTAIEEAGKLAVLRFLAHSEAEKVGINPVELNATKLGTFLREHPEKAREAAASSLCINAGADRRHGKHPISRIHRTSGLILIVRSGQWMTIRNSCLYVDLQFRPVIVRSPRAAVAKALAFYMICMAHEVVAQQAASAIENISGSVEFEEMQKAKLKDFMENWAASSDVDMLPFLTSPNEF